MPRLTTDWPTRAVVAYVLLVYGGQFVLGGRWVVLHSLAVPSTLYWNTLIGFVGCSVLMIWAVGLLVSRGARRWLWLGLACLPVVEIVLEVTSALLTRSSLPGTSPWRVLLCLVVIEATAYGPMVWACYRALRWSSGADTEERLLFDERGDVAMAELADVETGAVAVLRYERVRTDLALPKFLGRVTVAYSVIALIAGIVTFAIFLPVMPARGVPTTWQLLSLGGKQLGYLVPIVVGFVFLRTLRPDDQPPRPTVSPKWLAGALLLAGLVPAFVSLPQIAVTLSARQWVWWFVSDIPSAMAVPAFVYLMSRTR